MLSFLNRFSLYRCVQFYRNYITCFLFRIITDMQFFCILILLLLSLSLYEYLLIFISMEFNKHFIIFFLSVEVSLCVCVWRRFLFNFSCQEHICNGNTLKRPTRANTWTQLYEHMEATHTHLYSHKDMYSQWTHFNRFMRVYESNFFLFSVEARQKTFKCWFYGYKKNRGRLWNKMRKNRKISIKFYLNFKDNFVEIWYHLKIF